MPLQPTAFFLDAPGGGRFCLLYRPPGEPRGLVMYLHPFAEEMNKSRRMAALQARALCAAGFMVLQMDLLGCGDSAGDFGDASWEGWIDDALIGCRWLRAQGTAPLWLWGLRAGCLLAAAAARQLEAPCHLLFWAPTAAGKPLVQQFLRLKAAGDMAGGQGKAIMDGLRQQLAAGASVDVAGYTVSAALANGLAQAELVPSDQVGRVEWFELSTRTDATLTPASAKAQALWQQAKLQPMSHLVHGPAFWQTTEIEEAPDLIVATLVALTRHSATAFPSVAIAA